MAPGPRHPPVTSADLVRRLAPLMRGAGPDPQQPIAQRLGEWMGWTHAIGLSSVLGAAAPVAEAPAAAPAEAAAVAQRCSAERLAFVRAQHAGWAGPGGVEHDLPDELLRDYAPFRRHHTAQQRALERGVAALRARVRQAAGGVSARLRQLAALDAALEAALAARTRELLAGVPGVAERRFRALRDGGAADWRSAFAAEQRVLLHAELDLRLQPVDGLIAALHEEASRPR